MDSKPRPHDSLKRTLDLTVLSVEDLHANWRHAAQSLYVVVRADSIASYATGTATVETTSDGSGNPSWNEKLEVDVPSQARSVTLTVKCKNAPSMKDVGIARIAIAELLSAAAAAEQNLQILSYGLRDWEGRRSGVIKFNVRVRERDMLCSSSGSVVGNGLMYD
ncbi:hypothetical protein LR48_Vigan03g060300 [Vigna angularis]|uniref:C2 domain-containing protein n=1 Tax=Phaseolus angularis TaxID=3914 RepID=A0A0L9U3H0_PHAAN|nr:uncharacterized protein LOC108327245 [Vigna angularis]KAG2404406.1 uncharacterized protein HKW66_Vig0113280 [Vigna angularis]KOM37222.1 hypothetical protein LR48_Vigan03g060300 [Vigna angularis]